MRVKSSWKLLSMLVVCLTLFLVFSSTSTSVKKSSAAPALPITATFKPIEKPEEIVDNQTVEKIKTYFQKRHKSGRFNGAVLFAEGEKIIYKGGFGNGDIRRKRHPLTTKTPFQLASVTKPITATAVLMLQEWGYLTVQDTIQKFIPTFPYEGITIEHLLTQKSGLPEYLYFGDEHWKDWSKTITNEDVLCLMEIHEPTPYYRPNYRYNYVNTNYALLASIIEKTSGETYRDFMAKYIFEPLQMKNAFVYQRDVTDLPTTIGHDKRRRRIADSHYNGVVGDKGIYASVEDLFNFDKSLSNNELLCPETKELAFTPAHKRLYAHDNYGMGWRINTQKNGDKIIYHGGWWKGYNSYFIRMPYADKTIIVLTNSIRGGFISTKQLRSLVGE